MKQEVVSISRPRYQNGLKEICKHETFGHWEFDTVLSGQAKGCISTLIERMTRLYIGILLPNRLAQEIEMAVRQLHPQLPAGAIKRPRLIVGKNLAVIRR